MTGKVKKDSQYRTNLLENIGTAHPINNGIFMQVHHLISEKAVRQSGIGRLLITADYNINRLNNLVALPSTLLGACHLEVQLHRGDHTTRFPEDDDDTDNDDDHSTFYHLFITSKLDELEKQLKDECDQDAKELRHAAEVKMDALSSLILRRIENFSMPLTTISRSFKHGGDGCKNALSIEEHKSRSVKCGKNQRNHKGSEHAYSRKSGVDKIKLEKKPYALKVGQ